MGFFGKFGKIVVFLFVGKIRKIIFMEFVKGVIWKWVCSFVFRGKNVVCVYEIINEVVYLFLNGFF